jgi:outer membrane protein assembly factor BamB
LGYYFKIVKDTAGYGANLTDIHQAQLNNGDNILLFQNASYSNTAAYGRTDLFAFNLQTRQLQWKVNNFDIGSNVDAITVYNGNIYFLGHHTVHVFNLETGAKQWQYVITNNPNENFLAGHASLIVDNTGVYVKTNGELFFGLNLSGGLKWSRNDAGSSSGKIYKYKNNIYYLALGFLKGVDAQTGKELFSYVSPNLYRATPHSGSFNLDDSFVIDPIKQVIYIGDNYYAMCIKIPQ